MKELTKQEKKMYNDFVITLNNNNKDLFLESLEVNRGISSYQNKKTLSFNLETTFGLTEEKVSKVFDEFLKKYPYAHIEFNKPNLSVFAQMLMDKSETTLLLHQPITFEIIK